MNILATTLGLETYEALEKESDFNSKKFSSQSFKQQFVANFENTAMLEFVEEAYNDISATVLKAYNLKKASALALFQEHTIAKFRINACNELHQLETEVSNWLSPG